MWEMSASCFIWVASLLFFLFHLPGQLRARKLCFLAFTSLVSFLIFSLLFLSAAFCSISNGLTNASNSQEVNNQRGIPIRVARKYVRHLSIFLLTRPSTSIHYFMKFFSGRIWTPQPTGQRLLDEGASWSLKGKVEVYIYAHRYKLGHGKENIWSHIRKERKAGIFHEYYVLSQESCYPSMFSCSPVNICWWGD